MDARQVRRAVIIVLLFGLTGTMANGPAAAVATLEVDHPVLDHGIDAGRAEAYRAEVATVIAMSEEEMLSFLPDWSACRFCRCPACGRSTLDSWRWGIERPDEIRCTFCDTAFPNEAYPEDQVLTGSNALGEQISFPYHLHQSTGHRHFFTLRVMFFKREWLVRQCLALGRAYQATGDEQYARRVALVLDKLGRRYPHYPVMANRIAFSFRESQEPPYPWDSGKWGNFHDEIPRSLVMAYDMVVESQEFDRLSELRGYDVRRQLEEQCFQAAFEAAAAKYWGGMNTIGYDPVSAALLGKVVNRPRYVHSAFTWLKQCVDEGFFYDGMWKEGSPSYHYMTVGGLRAAFRHLEGYSDPPGYVDPERESRFDNLNPEDELPRWALLQHAPKALDFPTGMAPAFHDSWPHQRRSEARNETASAILPGMGHASLGRGSAAAQMQAQLHFSGGYGHAHLDNLSMLLYARGREMLPDLGYNQTQMAYWTVSTLAHNLVVVDRTDQVGRGSDGDLLWYFPNTGGVSVVEADGKRAYGNIEGMEMYQRMLAMVPVSDDDAYVVDVFRVRGGSVHDWTMQGDADEDTVATSSIALGGDRQWMLEEGEQWIEAVDRTSRDYKPYGLVRDVAAADAHEPFTVSFSYVAEPTTGVHIHMAAAERKEVFLGHSPSVRRAGPDQARVYDYWMPKLLVRRQGEVPLHSAFAAVLEPHEGDSFISTVERLELTPADADAVALRVTHGGAVDTIISTLDQPPYPARMVADGTELAGRLGIVRREGGRVTAMWLFEGEKLSAESAVLESPVAAYAGTISDVLRIADGDEQNSFVTHAELPEGRALSGQWMIVTHGNGYTHGYEIERVERQGDRTIIVLTMDHGLRIESGETQEVFFPLRRIAGENLFTIPLAASLNGL